MWFWGKKGRKGVGTLIGEGGKFVDAKVEASAKKCFRGGAEQGQSAMAAR